MPRDAQVGSITNTIKRERKEERDHTLYYIVTEREKKKERKRETEVENIVYGEETDTDRAIQTK